MFRKRRKESDQIKDTCNCSLLTIEPQSRIPGMDYVIVHVINNKAIPQQVVVTLFDTEKYPKQLVDERTVKVPRNCSMQQILFLGSIKNFAIEYFGPTDGVTAFVVVPKAIYFHEQPK